MRKIHVCAIFFAACMLVACDQTCPMYGSPNTTYNYSYSDNNHVSHFGSFTTDANGNAEIADVPDDIDCSRVTFSAAGGDDDFKTVDPPQS